MFSSYSNALRWFLLLFPLYRWGNCDKGKLCSFLRAHHFYIWEEGFKLRQSNSTFHFELACLLSPFTRWHCFLYFYYFSLLRKCKLLICLSQALVRSIHVMQSHWWSPIKYSLGDCDRTAKYLVKGEGRQWVEGKYTYCPEHLAADRRGSNWIIQCWRHWYVKS